MQLESFTTKKSAIESGFLTRSAWFKKFYVPKCGELPILVKGEEFFCDFQMEQIYSLSRGRREIGDLVSGAEPVGTKTVPRRSVKYQLYRESDFVFRPKKVCKVYPPVDVELLPAVFKAMDTAAKFEEAAKQSRKRGDRKRARGFRKRSAKLYELAELGIRRAINHELVYAAGNSGKTYCYQGEGYDFKSKVVPPDWL